MARTLTPAAEAFANACYAQNAPDELTAALAGPVDATDCATWGITAAEWRQAIEVARRELIITNAQA